VRALLNKRNEEADIASTTTVLQLLQQLVQAYGYTFEDEVLDDDGRTVRDGLIVMVNGRIIDPLEGVHTGLNAQDVLALLPLFAGGG
jgi:molybdopterin synthase sulfur carrier subunit